MEQNQGKIAAEKDGSEGIVRFRRVLRIFILGVVGVIVLGIATNELRLNKKDFTVTTQERVLCPNVTATETRGCVVDTSWSNWIYIADGPQANGMQVCATPGGEFERKEQNGTTFWRFRSESGHLLKQYRLFSPTVTCPPILPP